MIKIAGVQMDVTIGDVDGNIQNIIERFRTTNSENAKLTVFPECALTGYCFNDLEEAKQFAESVPGPATDRLAAACKDLNAYMVVGMLELDGTDVYNAAVLIGPEGVIANYRKVHLPYLGVDMFTSFGDRAFAVHNAGDVNVGMLICYDASFPEATRCLAMDGADLICLPTTGRPARRQPRTTQSTRALLKTRCTSPRSTESATSEDLASSVVAVSAIRTETRLSKPRHVGKKSSTLRSMLSWLGRKRSCECPASTQSIDLPIAARKCTALWQNRTI